MNNTFLINQNLDLNRNKCQESKRAIFELKLFSHRIH